MTAVGEFGGSNLRQRVFGDEDVFLGFKPQAATVRVAPLHDEFPSMRRKKQAALLLDERNALRTRFDRKRMRFETIQENSAGERMERAGD